MQVDDLLHISTIQEFFNIADGNTVPEGTRLLLESMTAVTIPMGNDIVTHGAGCEDGMYIILEGNAIVYSGDNKVINTLGCGDFIGEMGLINDDVRAATVRAATEVRCANISKNLFEEIATANRKIYGSFINMLYKKTTKLVTEQERIKSELAIAAKIQLSCLEYDFTRFNALPGVKLTAAMRPAMEVGGDFYDVFLVNENKLCFLIADVSGKGVPAALFMSMAKTHIKNFATVGLSLGEVAFRVNNELCHNNDEEMFVTAFICVLDLTTNEVAFINAGHNLPFVQTEDGVFRMIKAKANLVFGMMENISYAEQRFTLKPGESIYLYTDGVTEALNSKQELLGNDRLEQMLNRHTDKSEMVEEFVDAVMEDIDTFADGEMQADDITMVYITRR